MPVISTADLARVLHRGRGHDRKAVRASPRLADAASRDAAGALAMVASRREGLTDEEAASRLEERGPNVLARDRRAGIPTLLGHAVKNPLVVLLAALATLSALTGDPRAAAMMAAMIGLSVGLKLVQEARADRAAAALKAMISVTATVRRAGVAREVPVSQLVPGDVVQLAAGDMIPGDVRVLSAKDLFVLQGALTGESFPVEKFDADPPGAAASLLEHACLAFLGTSVASGSATAVVLATGQDTYLGGMAESLAVPAVQTAFDRDIARLTWLMIRFMAVMVPLVFVINGFTKHDWGQAFFFALAVAVGLTPEMLPMIVTVGLSGGAVVMSRKKVIVKRLNAIQNLGAMDVLCTDKTGTLTLDRVTLERYCDLSLRDDERVLGLAYVNSHFQTGLKSILDQAVLAHEETHAHARIDATTKVDEIPFDFERRLMSVVVRTPEGQDRLVAKGAPEAIFARCASARVGADLLPMDHPHLERFDDEHRRLCEEGFRVLAIATRDLDPRGAAPYGKADERDLVLEGYVAFLDPPKESAAAALTALRASGVQVKVVTGDNDRVARKICSVVGIPTERVLLGEDLDRMSDGALAEAAPETTLFARVSPVHKQRILVALQARGHTAGFMGDGINDAPALHAADVGISVDSAVDIAKESADVILLERSLLVLADGVVEGRKVFSNILKYVRMGASSNFGNMFSVLGASVLVPFLPMRPIQILTNNLLYDVGQTAVPTDSVDPEKVARPRAWNLRELTRFILFIGPCSSIFDYTTYFLMLRVFGCADVSTPAAAAHSAALFQTGWFVESLLTQTLIIHIIRTDKLPFVQSRPSLALLVTSLAVAAAGVALPLSPLAPALGFTRLPGAYWPALGATLVAYVALTQGVKALLVKRGWI